MTKLNENLWDTDDDATTAIKKALERTQLNMSGEVNSKGKYIGGRLGHTFPIDDTSSINAGISGHAAKGEWGSDVGIDRADIEYNKKLKNNHKIKASLGAGRGGIDSANIRYEIPFKKGGSVRGHGCEKRGKTRGKFR